MTFLAYSGRSPRRKSTLESRKKHPFGRGGSSRRLAFEPLEQRTLLAALPTLTALSVSASSVTSGQPVTFTAHVSVPSSPSGTPSGGTVTFTDGTTVLGTAPVVHGTASLAISACPTRQRLLRLR